MNGISGFLQNLKRRRDARMGRLPERHLDQPGIGPEDVAADAITPGNLSADWGPPVRLPQDVAFPPIETGKLWPTSHPTDS